MLELVFLNTFIIGNCIVLSYKGIDIQLNLIKNFFQNLGKILANAMASDLSWPLKQVSESAT